MEIVVNIYYKGKGTSARDFANEMISSGIVDEIRNEKGNVRYDYFFPLEDESTLLLIDAWENQKALDEHHASPMMAKIAALREKYDLTMKVEKFVADDKGFDEHDKKFVKN